MAKEWNKLDNAAKIFPAADGGADFQVFRVSCELYEKIDADILQSALDEAIEEFDVYRYVLQRGFFWYFLERSDIQPIVRSEYKPPCARLCRPDGRELMFEVTYFESRINLEVYHVLSDGTGAMNFLRTLVTKYLCMKYSLGDIPVDYDASVTQMKADSFSKYYSDRKKRSARGFKRACRIKGARLPENRIGVITGRVDAQKVLKISRDMGVTVTALLSACFMQAIGEELSERAKRRDAVIAIPVNLRKYFPSETARNFFLLVFAAYNFSKSGGDLTDIAKSIKSSLSESLTEERLAENINSYSAVEHNLFAKITPLRIKDIVLGQAYRLSMLQSTATVSNVGVIQLSEKLRKYIRAFDFFTGTNKIQMCLCSYGDVLSINFSSPFVSNDIQRGFFRKLTAMGIEVELFSNADTREDM